MSKLHKLLASLTRFAIVAGVVLVVPSCSKQDAEAPAPRTSSIAEADSHLVTQTYYGPEVAIGTGSARSWVKVDENGTPTSLGVDLTGWAVAQLDNIGSEYTLRLPSQVAVPPFDHIDIGWNPEGHEPDGIYNLPHYDLHFYMITSAFQSTIPGLAPPAFDLPMAPRYVAPAYVLGPGLVPNMGAHWIDVLAPEFQPGGVFSKTFIYGSYRGNLIFLEPMITRDYLRRLPNESVPIRQPQAFQRAGYYPTSYSFTYSAKPLTYHISLDNLRFRPAQ